MTDERIEKIARRVADVGNDYAEYEEGISHEMALAIAREIAPLVEWAVLATYCESLPSAVRDELTAALKAWVEP